MHIRGMVLCSILAKRVVDGEPIFNILGPHTIWPDIRKKINTTFTLQRQLGTIASRYPSKIVWHSCGACHPTIAVLWGCNRVWLGIRHVARYYE
jgi:hypothetical protein